jgi:hypothetical protein
MRERTCQHNERYDTVVELDDPDQRLEQRADLPGTRQRQQEHDRNRQSD